VFWIVDNASSHAGKTSIVRMQAAYPNARLIHLPVHASWLNQIEIYFSIVQRTRQHLDRVLDKIADRGPHLQLAA